MSHVQAAPPFQSDQCDSLAQEGDSLYRQAKFPAALQKWQDALTCYRKASNRQGEGTALNNIGMIYFRLGQYQAALKYYEQSLSTIREIGDRAGEGGSLNNIGLVYASLGQYEEARKYLGQALSIAREIGDRAGEGTILNGIGFVCTRLGQYEEARQHYEDALIIRREVSDRMGEEVTLIGLGGTHIRIGQYEQASKYFEQALSIAREIGDRVGEATTLNNFGGIYDNLGQRELARRYYEQALSVAREIGDRIGEGTILNNIGIIYADMGQYEEARKYLEQTLSIAREIGDRTGEGVTLNAIGFVYTRLGQHEEARWYHEQALSIAREVGDLAEEGRTLNDLGSTYYRLSQYEPAREHFEQALSIARKVGDHEGEATTLQNMGYFCEQRNQLVQALDFYQQAMNVRESLRGLATVEEFKTALADKTVDIYAQTTLLLLRLSSPAEAFNIVERARARTLLDQLGNARVNPTTNDPKLVEQEEQLRGEIQALDKQLRDEWAKPQNQRSQEVIQSITAQLESKRAEYAQLLQTLKLNNPEYASLVTVNPLTLTETQKILTNTTLIEYFVTVSQTVAFVVTQNDFHTAQITITEESLVKAVQDLYAFPSLEGVPVPVKTLYQHLIAPVKPYIKTDLVVIAPHGALHYVPFGALYDGEHYLVEQYTLFYTPSASVLPFAFAKRKAQVSAPLVLGDPDGSLPNSRQETQAIAQMYGTTAYVGKDALEQRVWKQSQEAGILHLSTHGVYNVHSPLFSHVLLAADNKEDGHLDVYEIYNRGLNLAKADLVVLSACKTNEGELSRGDEIVGLSRAFIYAGTPSVIASLWSVSDESTRVLMVKFYTHLREGMSKANALRAAQMEMIASGKYAHPYHWAAFGVTGDPGVGGVVPPSPTAVAALWATSTPSPLLTSGLTSTPTPGPSMTPMPMSVPCLGTAPMLALGVLAVVFWLGCAYVRFKTVIVSSRVLHYIYDRPILSDIVRAPAYSGWTRLVALSGLIGLPVLVGLGLWWYYFR